jgi:hypothetical protein
MQILDKIKKLHNKAEGAKAIGSEAEAQAFANKVRELMEQHKLSMTDIQFEEERKSAPVAKHWIKWEEHEGMKTKLRKCEWQISLAQIIAKSNSCKILIAMNSNQICLVGTESNRQIAEYVIVTMIRAAEKIAEKEYVTYFYKCRDEGDVTRARGFKQSFLDGFITRIIERYKERECEQENQMSTALVRVKTELKDAADYIQNLGTKSVALKQKTGNNQAGYERGQHVAGRVNLDSNGVSGSRPNQQIG